MTAFDKLLNALAAEQVEFILVGGAAAVAGICAHHLRPRHRLGPRARESVATGKGALTVCSIPPRHSSRTSVRLDEATLNHGLNFTLTTTLGDIDLLGEIPGGGNYSALAAEAIRIPLFGVECHCLTIRQLIRAKRAAGRPKDFDAIAELEAIEEESRNQS